MGMSWVCKCATKQHYKSHQAAERAARSLAQARDDDARFNAFRCKGCGGWVVGRREWGR